MIQLISRIRFFTLLLTKMSKSKTLIVNWGALAAATLSLWLASPLITAHPEIVTALTAALAAVNLVLRGLTGKPLDQKSGIKE